MKASLLFRNPRLTKLVLLFVSSLLSFSGLLAEESFQLKTNQRRMDARLEVIKAKVNGYFIDIQFRIHGRLEDRKMFENYPRNVYVIEESTGQKVFARKFSRIGTLGQRHLDEGLISSVRIENTGMRIRKHSRITFVVEELRQEHVVVEE